MNKGIISLTVVVFMMVMMVLILALLQSRILLGIQRTKGTADTILSTYNAESEIYDTLARLSLGHDFDLAKKERRLSDGTKLITEGHQVGADTVISFTAELPFATTKLEVTQKMDNTTTSFGLMDIVLALDCTNSMAECADPANQDCRNNSKQTRFEVLKQSVISFLDELEQVTDIPIRIGIMIFTGDGQWLKTTAGEEITPTSGVSIQTMKDTISQTFKKVPYATGSACNDITENFPDGGGTSQATGLQFMHKYFANKLPNTKQVEVLITDGGPTTAIPSAPCNLPYFVVESESDTYACGTTGKYIPMMDPTQIWSCKPYQGSRWIFGNEDPNWNSADTAERAFSCYIADKNTIWEGSTYGQRDPEVDSHVVVTYKLPATEPLKAVYANYPGVYVYDMDKATQLQDTLKNQVLGSIQSSIQETKIRRVIP